MQTDSITFQIALFVILFETVVSQCMSENLVGENRYANEKSCLIYGFGRRVGVYHYRMDDTIFKKSDAIQQLSTVARSIVFDILKDTDLIEINRSNLLEHYEKMRMAWTSLLSYLTLNNQFLIAVCARLSFALLPCYMVPSHVNLTYSELHGTIELCIERALIHNYADLELCAALVFSAPVTDIKKYFHMKCMLETNGTCAIVSDILPRRTRLFLRKSSDVLLKTRSWCVIRKSPHITLNLIRLARFCAVVLDDHSSDKQLSVDFSIFCAFNLKMTDGNDSNDLNHYYALTSWIKKLGRLNANFPQNISLDAIVQEFVRCLIPPEILIKQTCEKSYKNGSALKYCWKIQNLLQSPCILRFCKDFSLEITEALILYAKKMALKASVEDDQILAAEMHFIVFIALQLSTAIFIGNRCHGESFHAALCMFDDALSL
ncbi:hypothetical protein X798_01742 [Onchocerca flexuosa]|uniref:Uncharacterized protein n=1 Tax=Onchocerca flexuosa TaxID=387005 RepID=A0A238C2F9_9BILA|nr:hypothetical protein X798_01742 [Onchocerca flexuosa]